MGPGSEKWLVTYLVAVHRPYPSLSLVTPLLILGDRKTLAPHCTLGSLSDIIMGQGGTALSLGTDVQQSQPLLLMGFLLPYTKTAERKHT